MRQIYGLHNHSDYSNARGVLDCINTIDDLVDTAIEMELEGIALTDHDILSGSYKFLQKIKQVNSKGKELLEQRPQDKKAKIMANFKGFIGNEVYITREGLNKDTHATKEKFHHFILIAKDKKGWEQLNELSSIAWNRFYIRGITRTPLYISDLEKVIKKDPGHIIALTACLGNYLGERIIRFGQSKDINERVELKEDILYFINTMQNIFKENFYLELQAGTGKEQKIYNQGLVAFSRYLNIPLAVTTDSHYNRPEWREVHHYYLNSQEGKERETEGFYDFTYIMSESEVRSLLLTHLELQDIDNAIENTQKIGKEIEAYSLDHPPVIPKIPFENKNKWEEVIHKYDSYEFFHKFSNSNEDNQYLIYQIIKGIEDYINKGWINLEGGKVLDRVNIELEQVWHISERLNENLSTYFTTMQKIIDLTWEKSIVAPGRGSAGAFMINFLLGITQINPLTQPVDHPYGRFLHKEKISFPDVDYDSAASKRGEVIEHLKKWFEEIGATITNIATFGTEKSKSAVITAARSLNMEPEDGLYFASLIPSSRGLLWSLDECYYGNDEDKNPVKEFIKEMDNNPALWKIAKRIEGLISRRGVHAAGVVIFNQSPYKYCAIMKAPSGIPTTQYSLDDLEYTGSMKYDLLSTDAVDAIQTELYLLAEYGHIDWQGDLKSTYNKYLHPQVIDYVREDMWKLLNKKEILSIFQFDSPVGEQAIEEIQPQNLLELATINSVMRLMAAEGHEMPLIQYRRRKENPNLWTSEMLNAGLTKQEMGLLKQYVGDTQGMCITQEQLMAITQDPNIANFSYVESDAARKAIAKKKMKDVAKLQSKFYAKIKNTGCSQALADYVWYNLFQVQLGYAFSSIHTTAYSIIAIQEMNLNIKYPAIYWATARLMCESGSTDFLQEDLNILQNDEDEETEEAEQTSVNYFKMSSALGKIKSFGVNIALPDINESSFTFKPIEKENTIYFGLKGIARVGNPLIYEIINNRPYTSLQDFLNKVKVNKLQAPMLIKSGAFDRFGKREDILYQYCDLVADKKERLTLQNANKLIDLNLVPEELKEYSNLYKITKHLKKHFKFGNLIVPDENMWNYIRMYDFSEVKWLNNEEYIEVADWEKYYKKKMEVLKTWIKKNEKELLQQMNQLAVQELLDKYATGNIAQWEMEALSFYYTYHELEVPEYKEWLEKLNVRNFYDLPEEPIIEWEGNNGAKKFELSRIAGTAIGRDKLKNIVGILTPEGFLKVKIYKATFNKFDRQIKDEDGIEKSWFYKGTKLLLLGYRMGDEFKLKTYKNHPYGQMIYRIDGPGLLRSKRKGEE